MEALLPRCLDSLIIEKELLEKLEIIVVNDGSNDSSSVIAYRYQEKYPGVFKVIDKENGNYGSCVNRGLTEATGLYFKILDSDDWFDTGGLTAALKYIGSAIEYPDIIFTKREEVYSDGGKGNVTGNVAEDLYLKRLDLDNFDFIARNYAHLLVMHCMMTKTSILKENNYHQQEGISYTDTEFAYFTIKFCKTFVFLDYTLYYYCLGREGQTVDMKSKLKNTPSMYAVATRLLNDYNYDGYKLGKPHRSNLYSTAFNLFQMYDYVMLVLKKSLSKNEKEEFNYYIELLYAELIKDRDVRHKLNFVHGKVNLLGLYRKTGIRINSLYKHIQKIK